MIDCLYNSRMNDDSHMLQRSEYNIFILVIMCV